MDISELGPNQYIWMEYEYCVIMWEVGETWHGLFRVEIKKKIEIISEQQIISGSRNEKLNSST